MTTEKAENLLIAFQPGHKQISAMLDWFRCTKQWSWTKIALYTRLPHNQVLAIRAGRVAPTRLEMSAIWWLYVADVAPQSLTNEVFLASWGRLAAENAAPPPALDMDRICRQAAAICRRIKKERQEITLAKLGAVVMQETGYNYDLTFLWRLARANGLVMPKAHWGANRKPKPESQPSVESHQESPES